MLLLECIESNVVILGSWDSGKQIINLFVETFHTFKTTRLICQRNEPLKRPPPCFAFFPAPFIPRVLEESEIRQDISHTRST